MSSVMKKDVIKARWSERDLTDGNLKFGTQPGEKTRAVPDMENYPAGSHSGVHTEPLTKDQHGGGVVIGAEINPVAPKRGLQFGWPPLDDNPATVNDRDPTALLGFFQVMSSKEHGGSLLRTYGRQVRPQQGPGAWVQAERRLVQEQHSRPVKQAAGDLEAALQPTRQCSRQRPPPFLQAGKAKHLIHSPAQRCCG